MKDEFICNRVTQLRMRKNISEVQMSYELGRSKNYIHSITSGKVKPSMDSLKDICDSCNVTRAQFFEPLLEGDNIIILKLITSLKEEDKQTVIRIINGLIKEE